MADAIKECPFCGAQPTEQAIDPHDHSPALVALGMPGRFDGSHTIECGCGAGMIANTRAEVLAMWSRRAQQPAQGEAVAFDLTLDEDEARTLRDGIGDGCVQAVRLQIGEGHSGYGLYVSSSEYPEDGSALVCEMIERTAPPAPAVPADWQQWVSSAYRTLRKHNSSIPDDVLDRMRDMLAAPTAPSVSVPDVDTLAQFIRAIDGRHNMGAGLLAERICEWLASGGKASVPSVEQPTAGIRDAGPAAFGGRKTRRE